MAYIEGHGPSGDGSPETWRDEPDRARSRTVTLAVAGATAVILLASLIFSDDRDTSPWTSGSLALWLGLAAIVTACLIAFRAIRRDGGSKADGALGTLMVALATPIAATFGYVVLAILRVTA